MQFIPLKVDAIVLLTFYPIAGNLIFFLVPNLIYLHNIVNVFTLRWFLSMTRLWTWKVICHWIE